MKLLFDANALLDFFLDREPHSTHAAHLLTLAEQGEIQGCVCADSLTTIFYLLRKAIGNSEARRCLAELLRLLEVSSVGRSVIEKALESKINDFEDAVVAESAVSFQADLVVTRNQRDFEKSRIPVQDPRGAIAILRALEAANDEISG